MQTKPTFPQLGLATRFVAATIAATIAIATLTFVTELFQRDGRPAHSRLAERANTAHVADIGSYIVQTGRTSTVPCAAAGQRSAQDRADSRSGTSIR
jgi:hypothetical protein